MQQSKAFSFYAHGLLWTRNKLHVAIDEEEDYKNYLRIKPLNVLASYLYLWKTKLQDKSQVQQMQAHQN